MRHRTQHHPIIHLASAFLLAGAFACSPEDGARGPAGPEGLQGPEGPAGGLDPSLSTVEKILASVGGAEALGGLERFRVVAQGTRYMPGEGFDPNEEEEVITSTFTSTLSWDLTASSWRADYTRSTVFIPLPFPLVNSEIVTGTIGAVIGNDSLFTAGVELPPAAMLSSRWAARSKQFGLLHPHGALQDVLAGNATVAEAGFGLIGGVPHEILEMQSPVAPVQIWVNPGTGYVAKVVTYESDVFFRDRILEVFYLDWQSFDGVAFPMEVLISFGGELIHEERRTLIEVNPDFAADLLTLPETDPAPAFDAELAALGGVYSQFFNQFVGLGVPLDFWQVFVQGNELQDGVWHLTGGSHHSMAIEQENSIIVVEPALYPERSQAVIAWVNEQFPGKPISHIVVTHHHEDHAGGIREYVAEGATVVAAENGRDIYLKGLTASSEIVPDGLSAQTLNPSFELVPLFGEITIDDATNPVTVHHFSNVHSSDLVAVFLENGGFYFESDLYNPGDGGFAINFQGAQDLRDAITNSGYDVQTIVGGHGATAPLSELDAYLSED